MRVTCLFIMGVLLSIPAYACITPLLLPPYDVKILLEKKPLELTPMDVARVDEFKRDLQYYNGLSVTCMGSHKELDEIHRSIQNLLKEKWNK